MDTKMYPKIRVNKLLTEQIEQQIKISRQLRNSNHEPDNLVVVHASYIINYVYIQIQQTMLTNYRLSNHSFPMPYIKAPSQFLNTILCDTNEQKHFRNIKFSHAPESLSIRIRCIQPSHMPAPNNQSQAQETQSHFIDFWNKHIFSRSSRM